MKFILFFLTLCATTVVFGQDTLVKNNGSIVPVKILDLDEKLGLITYEIDGQTKVASLSSLQSYTLHSVLSHDNDDLATNVYVVQLPVDFQVQEKKQLRYTYSPWSVSTNLTALFNFGPTNSRLSIEPEYTVNDYFSVKTPLTFGVFNNYSIGVNDARQLTYKDYSYNEFTTVNNPPSIVNNVRLRDVQHLVGQIGINPKIYPFKKDAHIVSFYLSPSLIFGVTERYAADRYDKLDTMGFFSSASQSYSVYWEITTDHEIISSNRHFFYNYEFLAGLDFHFGKYIGLTLETGYASKIKGEPLLNDKVYASTDGGPYQLIRDETPDFSYGHRNRIRFRVLFTYRFGGQLR